MELKHRFHGEELNQAESKGVIGEALTAHTDSCKLLASKKNLNFVKLVHTFPD